MEYQMDIDGVADRILLHFGDKLQRLKAIEELSECAARLAKDAVENMNPADVSLYDETIDEIADATIMLRQMRLAYGWKAVDMAIERKLKRMIDRINL